MRPSRTIASSIAFFKSAPCREPGFTCTADVDGYKTTRYTSVAYIKKHNRSSELQKVLSISNLEILIDLSPGRLVAASSILRLHVQEIQVSPTVLAQLQDCLEMQLYSTYNCTEVH